MHPSNCTQPNPRDFPASPTLVAFDVETTGLRPDTCGITELAAVRFTLDGTVLDTFISLAHPGCPVPPRITAITGIDDAMLKDAPPACDVIRAWTQWLGPTPLLFAHNAPFDAAFIHGAMKKAGIRLRSFPLIDTVAWARRHALPVADHSLGSLLAHIGHRTTRLHRAEADARGVAALAAWLLRREPLQDDHRRYEFLRALSTSSRRHYRPRP